MCHSSHENQLSGKTVEMQVTISIFKYDTKLWYVISFSLFEEQNFCIYIQEAIKEQQNQHYY